jgi:anti-anti-sigma factor
MVQTDFEATIRERSGPVRVLGLRGRVTGSAEKPLTAAYEQAGGAGTVILDFSGVEVMDSAGLGLLIALQAQAQRQKQRLVACGLSAPLRQAFAATYLDEALPVYADVASAKALAGPGTAHTVGARANAGKGPQGGWAAPIDRLVLPPVPREAINLNVQGRRATGPVKGFGPLWLRTYKIRLSGASVSPAELIATWKAQFAGFWPPGSLFYGADRPIEAGDAGLLNLAGPMGTTIATGVFVAYADETSFCFLSVEGHMFGGMITFSAYEQEGATFAQVQALLRSSDPVYEMGQRLRVAVKAEDAFWNGTLANLAAHFGVEGEAVQQEAVMLDKSIHWGRVTNLWHSAAMRTTLYLPVHWVRRLLAR